jgi:uncharacterized membrane protein HdeD (DUF308 family)
MLELVARYWWAFLLRGILGVVFGVSAFTWPGLTLMMLVLLFGAFAFADGVVETIAAIRNRSDNEHWWLHLLEGLFGIAIGVATFFWPAITAQALLLLIAAWAIVTGLLEILVALRLRKEIEGEWLLILGGGLSIVFGALLVLRPGAGALAVVWIIAAYAAAFGVILIMLSFKLRRIGKSLAPRTA